MKRMLRAPAAWPQASWPMDPPRGRATKADRWREPRRTDDDTGAEKLDRSTLHRHDRRCSRDRLRNLRGSLEIEEDDTRW